MSGWILGIDGSTPRCVLVIGKRGGELVAWDDEIDPPNQTSSRLLPRLRALQREAGVDAGAIEVVACGCGPGTFTGTRVAVATAKGIALGLGVPAIGTSTLAAIAFSAEYDGLVLPLLDARRGQVYGALFECVLDPPTLHARTDEQCVALEELVASLDDHAPPGLVGPGADVIPVGTAIEAYGSALPDAWRERAVALPGPTPAGLWRAIAAADRAGGAVDAARLDAIYLRKSYAELGVNRPKRPVRRSPFL